MTTELTPSLACRSQWYTCTRCFTIEQWPYIAAIFTGRQARFWWSHTLQQYTTRHTLTSSPNIKRCTCIYILVSQIHMHLWLCSASFMYGMCIYKYCHINQYIHLTSWECMTQSLHIYVPHSTALGAAWTVSPAIQTGIHSHLLLLCVGHFVHPARIIYTVCIGIPYVKGKVSTEQSLAGTRATKHMTDTRGVPVAFKLYNYTHNSSI